MFGEKLPPSNGVWFYDFGATVRVCRDSHNAFAYSPKRPATNGPYALANPDGEDLDLYEHTVTRYTLKNAHGDVKRFVNASKLLNDNYDDDDAAPDAKTFDAFADSAGELRRILEEDIAPEAPLPDAARAEPEPSIGPANNAPTNTTVVDHPVQQRITQFLQRVVPWPEKSEDDGTSGYVNVHWTIVYPDGRPGMAGKPVRTVTEFLRLVAWILRLSKPGNIYFCLSLQSECTQNKKGRHQAVRSAKNALAFKAVWLDLDVKEGGYATMEEAVAALVEFVRRYKLPVPSAVVISGSGLHVYWISKRTLPVDEWRLYAEGLKAAALEFGLRCDVACTVNAAQILRVPGTLNFKTNPPKRVYLDPLQGEDLDFATDLKMLVGLVAPKSKGKKGAPKGKPVEIPEAFRQRGLPKGLGEGIVIREAPPLPLEPIMAECPLFKEAYETHGADAERFANPIWNLINLATVFMVDGHKLAHDLGDKHPDYDEVETNAQFERKSRENQEKGIGWPSCRAFQDAGATHCKTCPHRDEGTSPLNLGWQQYQELPLAEPPPGRKPPLIVELGSRLWGAAAKMGDEYRFGGDQSKIIDPRRGIWFDFTANKGGTLRDLIKKIEAANHKQSSADDIVLVCAADVVARSLDWIWEGHLLRGSQELMSGLPDLSKSTVQIGYIACATARLPWPDGTPAIEPTNVIMLTAEHTLDQIVVPRLLAAGADLGRVKIIKCIKTDERNRQFLLAEDLDRLERLVKKVGDVGLITIDPITAYMGGGKNFDSHRATDVRGQLGPLKDFSERMNIALSTITHPAKNAGQRALDHFIGSQAFIAACRVGHLCVAEMEESETGEQRPTGRVLFINVRNAAHAKMPTLAYRKEIVTVSTEPRSITAPRIKWEGSVDITAEAAIAAASGKKQPDPQPQVQALLREMLKDGKPIPYKDIEEAAAKNGFTEKQLRTAREKLGLHTSKEEGKMDGGWFWQLPDPSKEHYHY